MRRPHFARDSFFTCEFVQTNETRLTAGLVYSVYMYGVVRQFFLYFSPCAGRLEQALRLTSILGETKRMA